MDDENQNNVSSTEESDIQESNNQSMVNSGAQRVANAGANKLKKKITEKATKEASKAAVKKGVMMALSHVIFWVAIIIIALVVLIGIAMFFVTMPGMLMEKLKELGKAIGDAWASWFGKSDDSFVDRKQVYEVMDYIEQMGYNLKEHGFLTHYLDNGDHSDDYKKVYRGAHKEENEIQHEDLMDDETCELDEDQGVYRSSDTGLIVAGCSDFIMQYIISDNYMYTIRNFNVSTENWWDAVFNHIAALFGDSMNDRRGMILLLHDNGGVGSINYNFWGEEDAYDASERGYIKIDPQAKKMLIKKGWISSVEIEYDLDGWTGRYGMPLEFLLSVHAATLMPDLAYDMTQAFDTNVRILLNETDDNSIIASYKCDDGSFVSETEIQGVMETGLFAGLSFSHKEAANVINLGIIPPGPPEHKEGVCTCKFEDGKCVEANGACYDYIKAVASVMNEQTTEDFTTYSPYIESVRNHWYRDVYFVVPVGSDLSFVKNDYNYEALMRERWTEYETWGSNAPDPSLIGKYKLYKVEIDANGNYTESDSAETNPDIYRAYENTRNQGQDVTVKYVKRAKQIDVANDYEDLYWQLSADGKAYMAYSTDTGENASKDKMFDNDKIAEEKNELKRIAKEHIYAELTMNVVSQVGDGLRTTTNPTIKKMFLTNKYFRYDGTREKAEQITKLREDHELDYGPLSEEDMGKSIEYSSGDITPITVKVSDVSGSVEINQDSINAFSMLENTHTLDADFIYRDFKELIVELGFFTKEELMDSVPKVLEFPVPDIGSYGYPKRALDKREDDKGTLMHSKKEYEALSEQDLALIVQFLKEAEDEPTSPDPGNMGSKLEGLDLLPLAEQLDVLVGANIPTGDGEKSCSQVSLEEWLAKCDEIMTYQMDNNFRYYSHPEGAGGGALKATWEEGKVAKNVCCATYVSWCLQEVGVMSGHSDYCGGFFPWIINVPGVEVISDFYDLQEGDIMFYSDTGEGWVSEATPEKGAEHVDIFYGWTGAPGTTYYIYSSGHCNGADCSINCGGGGKSERSGPGGIGVSHSTYFAIRLPWGKSHDSDVYEGYKGNEAVVSPLTGILLEYGTYDDDDKIANTLKTAEGDVKQETYEYRENVDLNKPIVSPLIEGSVDENNNDVSSQRTDDATEKEKVVDKVGYAKILALKPEHVKMLEKASSFADGSLLSIGSEGTVQYEDPLHDGEQLKKWDEEQKTVYAFKEFAQNYRTYGIEGFVMYIDGFVCELPEEVESSPPDEENPEEEEKDKEYKTQFDGEDLTFDVFKSVSLDDVKNKSTDERIQSDYIADDDIQLSSKSATEQANAEIECRSAGFPVVNVDGMVFIKEGTIIGRTMSDIEANSSTGGGVTIRKNPEHEFEYYRKDKDEDDDDEDKKPELNENGEVIYEGDRVIGNYMRFMFFDNNNEVVENVEDYMKLDELQLSDTRLEPQPYKQNPDGFDAYRLQSMVHHELCAGSSLLVNLAKVRDKSGKWRLLTKEDSETISKVTVYVCLNNAIEQDCYISEILTSGAYGDAGYEDDQCRSIICPDCYEIAQWCLKWDCTSVESSEGVTMTRNCRTESAFDVSCSGWTPGVLEHWWLIDAFDVSKGGYGADGLVSDYHNNNSYDAFFLRMIEDDEKYKAKKVPEYTNVQPCPN